MKIKETIKQLEDFLEKYGDLEIVHVGGCLHGEKALFTPYTKYFKENCLGIKRLENVIYVGHSMF